MAMGMGMGTKVRTGNGTEFKPDSRALPDAADFDLYLIVCKQCAEYPTVCMEYGWMVRQTNTQNETHQPYTAYICVCFVCAVTYAGDLFEFFAMKLIDYCKSIQFPPWGMMTNRPPD